MCSQQNAKKPNPFEVIIWNVKFFGTSDFTLNQVLQIQSLKNFHSENFITFEFCVIFYILTTLWFHIKNQSLVRFRFFVKSLLVIKQVKNVVFLKIRACEIVKMEVFKTLNSTKLISRKNQTFPNFYNFQFHSWQHWE